MGYLVLTVAKSYFYIGILFRARIAVAVIFGFFFVDAIDFQYAWMLVVSLAIHLPSLYYFTEALAKHKIRDY